MNIAQTHIYNTCIFLRKIISKDTKSQITLTKKIDYHKRATRQTDNYCLQIYRTNMGKKSILCEGVQNYNNLPKTIKDAKSLPMFKKLLKDHILKDQSLIN
jgi:hypothetical protein